MTERRKRSYAAFLRDRCPLLVLSKQYVLHFSNLEKKMGVGFIYLFYKTVSQSMHLNNLNVVTGSFLLFLSTSIIYQTAMRAHPL